MPRNLIACLSWTLAALAGPLPAAEPIAYGPDLLAMADKGDAEAFAKLLNLAEGGHARAQYDVGRHYLRIIKNVDDDMPRILTWMQRAAEQGVSEAQIDLGVTLNMPGKPWHDAIRSLSWFNVGMALTLEENPDGARDHYAVFAGNNAFQLSQSLSKEQVRESESLGRAWLDEHGVSAQDEGRNLKAFLDRIKARKQ